MEEKQKCAVCRGRGKIELLETQCPFCNGTGEYTKISEKYFESQSVNVFFWIERYVLYVKKNAIMILQTNQNY